MRIFVLFLSALLFVFISCQTYYPPKTYNFEKSRTYSKTFDEVWGKIVQWFAVNNIPIKTIDKASGIIATEYNIRIDNNTDVMDCGYSEAASEVFENHRISFNILAVKESEKVNVIVNIFPKCTKRMKAYGMSKDKLNEITCESTGNLRRKY